jgi:F-type H+-transporting ATPase subunit a
LQTHLLTCTNLTMLFPISANKFTLKSSLLILLLFVSFSAFVSAQDQTQLLVEDSLVEKHEATDHKANEKFDPGKMIMEHVVDNHEWHIAEIGNFHLTIPLPVLIIYDGKFYAFWSSKFHNEGHSYKGFTIAEEGANKGKIISLQSEKMGENGPKVYDFSFTKTVFAIFISGFLLILIFVSIANKYNREKGKAPSGIQNLLEPLILFIRDDVAKSSIGEKRYERYMPYLLTIFFFIFFNNLLGIVPLFPGGANVTGNIAVTGVMAVCTLIITSFTGTKHYWLDIINTPGVPWWLKLPVPLMPIVEIIGIITKPFVLMVRLFANMTAGHIIILGFISIIIIFGQISTALGIGVAIPTVAFMIFMDLLELLVAFIQAYVFTLLSALYFGLAYIEPEHH